MMRLIYTVLIYNSAIHDDHALSVRFPGNFADQVLHRLLRHLRHIYFIGRNTDIAQPRRLVVVIPHHGNILWHPVAALLQLVDQICCGNIIVAYEGGGHIFRQLP